MNMRKKIQGLEFAINCRKRQSAPFPECEGCIQIAVLNPLCPCCQQGDSSCRMLQPGFGAAVLNGQGSSGDPKPWEILLATFLHKAAPHMVLLVPIAPLETAFLEVSMVVSVNHYIKNIKHLMQCIL